MSLSRIVRALLFAMLASAVVYGVMMVASDGAAVVGALLEMRPGIVLLMLGLSVGCYLLRGYRWGFLMRLVGYPVRVRDALYLHVSGQTMSVSPGRLGEVLKPWLAREAADMPMSKGIALVFSERVADLIGVCILSLGGLSAIGGGVWALVAALGAVAAGTALASSAWFHRLALGVVAKQRWAQRHRESAEAMSATIRAALSSKALSWSVLFSICAWGFEGVGFWLCLRELGFSELGGFAAVSVYAVSTIVGALTFLPGGIGLTEASMMGILIAVGMEPSAASAATLLTRVVTLWWAVLLGWIALASRPRLLGSLLSGSTDVESDPVQP